MTHTIGWYGTNRGLHAFSGQLDCCRCHLQCRWALPTATAATAVQNRMRPHNDKPISKVTGIASLGLGESPLLGCCETVLCSHILRKEIHHMHSTNMHPPPPHFYCSRKCTRVTGMLSAESGTTPRPTCARLQVATSKEPPKQATAGGDGV